MKKKFVSIAVILALALIATGCDMAGDGGSGSGYKHPGGFITVTGIPDKYIGYRASISYFGVLDGDVEYGVSGDGDPNYRDRNGGHSTKITGSTVKMPAYKTKILGRVGIGISVIESPFTGTCTSFKMTWPPTWSEAGFYIFDYDRGNCWVTQFDPVQTFVKGNLTLKWNDRLTEPNDIWSR